MFQILLISLLSLSVPAGATSIAHQKAPDFPSTNGKVVLVHFGKPAAYLKKLDARYRPLGLTIVKVSEQDRPLHDAYGVASEPAQFLIGPDRLIVYSHHGKPNTPALEQAIQQALDSLP